MRDRIQLKAPELIAVPLRRKVTLFVSQLLLVSVRGLRNNSSLPVGTEECVATMQTANPDSHNFGCGPGAFCSMNRTADAIGPTHSGILVPERRTEHSQRLDAGQHFVRTIKRPVSNEFNSQPI